MWSQWCETVWPELYRQLTEHREPQAEVRKKTFWTRFSQIFKKGN